MGRLRGLDTQGELRGAVRAAALAVIGPSLRSFSLGFTFEHFDDFSPFVPWEVNLQPVGPPSCRSRRRWQGGGGAGRGRVGERARRPAGVGGSALDSFGISSKYIFKNQDPPTARISKM